MEDRGPANNFERDETKDVDLRGDGCQNCTQNPRYRTKRMNMGKPNVDRETFEGELGKFKAAYGYDIEADTHDVYWEHLAYTFMDNADFKEVMYQCIDTFAEFPTIADILQTAMEIKMLNS